MNLNQKFIKKCKPYPTNNELSEFLTFLDLNDKKKYNKIDFIKYIKKFDYSLYDNFILHDYNNPDSFSFNLNLNPIFSNNLPNLNIFNNTPFIINKSNIRHKDENFWIKFFIDFSPNLKKSYTIEKWEDLTLNNFYEFLSKTDPNLYDNYYNFDTLMQESLDSDFFFDSTYFNFYSSPSIYYFYDRFQLIDECYNFLNFLLHKAFSFSNKQSLNWLSELGYKKIFDVPLPDIFKKFVNKVKLFHKKIDFSLFFGDFDSFESLIRLSIDEEDSYNSPDFNIPKTKKSLKEFQKLLKYQHELYKIFDEILTSPDNYFFPLYISYENFSDIPFYLENKTSNISYKENDMDEKENIYWEIFFSHYYPNLFKTNWKVKNI